MGSALSLGLPAMLDGCRDGIETEKGGWCTSPKTLEVLSSYEKDKYEKVGTTYE